MEEYLKTKISRLNEEIKQLEKRGYATHKKGIVYEAVHDSDLGVKVPIETTGWVSMSSDELKASKKNWELKLYSLRSELKQAQDELFKLEWAKPENVAKRQQEEAMRSSKEQEKKLEEERLEHEEAYEYLNKLVKYLELAGMDDLAGNLSKLRFAKLNRNSDYVQKEIDLLYKTTGREYGEIKKSVLKLTKKATRMARNYKELYNLYKYAYEIVSDIEEKGISKKHGQDLILALKKYFTEPTGKYYLRKMGNNYGLGESSNLGYEHLAFYRDYGSKYNEDVRKHKI